MACDDERSTRVKHDVVWGERGRHARAQRERLGVGIARIKADLAQGRRRNGDLRAVQRNCDTVRERDLRRDRGMLGCYVGRG